MKRLVFSILILLPFSFFHQFYYRKYIKIIKVEFDSKEEIVNTLYNKIGDNIDQQKATHILERLYEVDLIGAAELDLFKAIIDRKTLQLNPALRDGVRARVLKQIFRSVLRKEA